MLEFLIDSITIGGSIISGIVGGIAGLALFYMSIVLMINRFQDLGKSGWSVLFLLVPFYNIYLALLLAFSKGDQRDNEYGKYMDKQIVFNPAADKTFTILTELLLIFSVIGFVASAFLLGNLVSMFGYLLTSL